MFQRMLSMSCRQSSLFLWLPFNDTRGNRMSDLFTPTFILILIFSTIRSATPLIFAALGGMFSERSGVINIALEGLMLAGAFTAAVVTYELSNPYLGFL